MIGNNSYKTGQNLEPIASAITSMGQSANKKDKPTILGEKIKAISTDATAVESQVLTGKTFYASGSKKTGGMPNKGAWSSSLGVNGKVTIPQGYHDGNGYVNQSITTRGSITPAVSVTGTSPMYVRMNQGYYGTNASSGYPETSVTLAQMRGAGFALQSELTSMTNDRNNWMNTANSKFEYQKGNISASQHCIVKLNLKPNSRFYVRNNVWMERTFSFQIGVWPAGGLFLNYSDPTYSGGTNATYMSLSSAWEYPLSTFSRAVYTNEIKGTVKHVLNDGIYFDLYLTSDTGFYELFNAV